jgi:hypothetical protein
VFKDATGDVGQGLAATLAALMRSSVRFSAFLRSWYLLEVEQSRVSSSYVQDWRDPFQGVSGPQDLDTPTSHGLIDGTPDRDGSVETTGEPKCGGIADAELHRGDGVDAAMHQRFGGSGE